MNRTRRRGGLVTLAGLVALVVLGLLGTGCDVSPSAATVNGSTITQNQLDSQLSTIVDTGAAGTYTKCLLELEGGLPNSVGGAGGDTVSTQLASYELSTMILQTLISQDLTRRHRAVNAADIVSARQDFEQQVQIPASSGSTSPCGVSGRPLFDKLPASFSALQVHNLADEEQLAATIGKVHLGTADLQRYYFAHAQEFAQICVSVIAVSTQSSAQSILSSINSGATTFSQAAEQSSLLSQSQANGGALPCTLTSTLQGSPLLSAIGSLAPGQISQPASEASSSGGTIWLLIRMNGRPELPFAQAVSQIRQDLLSAQNPKVTREFDRITAEAHVSVDPRYGNWSSMQGVRPPVPPAQKDVLSPSADIPPGSTTAAAG